MPQTPDVPEIPPELFESAEDEPGQAAPRKARRTRRGKPRTRGKQRRPARRKTKTRRGVPLWAWLMVALGWLIACGVTGVVGWKLVSQPAAPAPETPNVLTQPAAGPTISPSPSPSPMLIHTPSPTASPTRVPPSPTPTLPGAASPAVPQLPPTEVEIQPSPTATSTPTPLPSPTFTPTPLPTPTFTVPPETPTTTPVPTPTPPPPTTDHILLIPLYIYPSEENLVYWQQVAQARQDIAIVVIINPNNGPGGPPDDNYRRAMNLLKQAGVTLIGYVPTGYGKRLSEAIRADISMYDTYYPQIDGIFFDEVPTEPRYINKYRSLEAYARSFFNGPIVFNPGTVPDIGYFEFGDVWVVFEDMPTAWQDFAPPQDLDGERTAVLVHTAAVGEMRRIVRDVRRYGLGYVYITDDREPNPWDTLPSYLNEEIRRLLGR